MRNPFRSTPATPAPAAPAYDPKNPPPSPDGWDPVKMRELVFRTLAGRVGPDAAQALREDFDHHLDEDPVNGVESAWICLCGKLVETIDKFNEMLGGALPGPNGPVGGGDEAPVSPFTMYRKDG